MVGNRLEEIIKLSGLSKTKFAELAQIDASYIPKIISGEKTPSDRVIKSICTNITIGNGKRISEDWLRTGEGEMFLQMDPEDELMEWAGRVLAAHPHDFRKRFVKMLTGLSDEQWHIMEAKILELAAQYDDEDNKKED